MKNSRLRDEDGITTEMPKIGEATKLLSVELLLNRHLLERKVPQTWKKCTGHIIPQNKR